MYLTHMRANRHQYREVYNNNTICTYLNYYIAIGSVIRLCHFPLFRFEFITCVFFIYIGGTCCIIIHIHVLCNITDTAYIYIYGYSAIESDDLYLYRSVQCYPATIQLLGNFF